MTSTAHVTTARATRACVNSNILADETLVDPLSGNAVFNGILVEVAALA